MTVDINKEITNFKENWFSGLSKRQTLAGLGMCAALFGSMYIEKTYIGGEVATYIAYVLIAVLGIIGFYNKDGLNGEEFIVCLYRYMRQPKDLFAGSFKSKGEQEHIRKVEIPSNNTEKELYDEKD